MFSCFYLFANWTTLSLSFKNIIARNSFTFLSFSFIVTTIEVNQTKGNVMKLANMNAGKSLRVLMEENDVSAKKLGNDLGVSATTVSTLRREKLISGSNLVMLSEYFKLSAADFIRKGEEEVS